MSGFLRRLHALWLKKRFAALEREIRWNAQSYEEVVEQLRSAQMRVARKLHRAEKSEDAPPELVVCVGDMRVRAKR